MRLPPFAAAAVAAATAVIAGPALAAPCYVIYDRNDTVIYRDYEAPFDLGNPKSPEREMMRRQGQHLLIAEFEKCNPVGFISAATGGTAATVDEIVAQLRPAIGTSVTTNAVMTPVPAGAGRLPTAAPASSAVTIGTGGGGYTVR